MMSAAFIKPDWPAPERVKAVTTTRLRPSAASPLTAPKLTQSAYEAFNLATHVGDVAAGVIENRQLLKASLGLAREPCWLQQTHSSTVYAASDVAEQTCADASFTRHAGLPCVVLTADCLPVLLCDRQGTVVAAVHAGWRGLQGGIIAAAVAKMACEPAQLLAWLGPAIGPEAYEVSEEVYHAFTAKQPAFASAFQPNRLSDTGQQHWLLDLYAIARRQLQACGIVSIYGGEFCTYTQSKQFYSYRRDLVTGRMASLIWLS